ncbi:MAG: hypothetical protein ACPKPY_06000 [Nitrososphaeraceae archaeon]
MSGSLSKKDRETLQTLVADSVNYSFNESESLSYIQEIKKRNIIDDSYKFSTLYYYEKSCVTEIEL